jgi:SAM-dependent methyltransferase
LPTASVLEIGSYDVNGSVRRIFQDAVSYVGVDLTPGPGVDQVSYGHLLDEPAGSYDIVISGECFEHDQHWAATLTNMARLTRPGGVVAFTCASTGRPEHGTRRTEPGESPGTQAEGLDYYQNLTENDVWAHVDVRGLFTTYGFWSIPTSFDLYFAGIRSGRVQDAEGALPSDDEVRAIADLMPLAHRAIRWPLRALHAVLPEPAYQTAAIRYWRVQQRAQNHPCLGRFRRSSAT